MKEGEGHTVDALGVDELVAVLLGARDVRVGGAREVFDRVGAEEGRRREIANQNLHHLRGALHLSHNHILIFRFENHKHTRTRTRTR